MDVKIKIDTFNENQLMASDCEGFGHDKSCHLLKFNCGAEWKVDRLVFGFVPYDKQPGETESNNVVFFGFI